jgi:hypothetical protein
VSWDRKSWRRRGWFLAGWALVWATACFTCAALNKSDVYRALFGTLGGASLSMAVLVAWELRKDTVEQRRGGSL